MSSTEKGTCRLADLTEPEKSDLHLQLRNSEWTENSLQEFYLLGLTCTKAESTRKVYKITLTPVVRMHFHPPGEGEVGGGCPAPHPVLSRERPRLLATEMNRAQTNRVRPV